MQGLGEKYNKNQWNPRISIYISKLGKEVLHEPISFDENTHGQN